jgi:phage terminase large subunit
MSSPTQRSLALADRAAAMSRITMPVIYEGLFRPKFTASGRPVRYRIGHGGRGAGRSWSFGRALLRRALAKRRRIICARELMASVDDSVHALLSDQIRFLELGRFFEVQAEAIYGDNGSEIVYTGLRHNTNRIRSFEGADVIWVEEAQPITEDTWRTLVPTIRRPESEIWATFNPDLKTDSTYRRFVLHAPENAIVLKTTFRDNPHFPAVLEDERAYLERVDDDAYRHVWLGECRAFSDAQVLKGKYVAESFVPGADWSGPYFGLDFGFSQDPTAGVKAWVHEHTLYIEHEVWALGCEIDALPDLLDELPGAREHVMRADSGRPDSISFLQRHRYDQVRGAEKGAGSVREGIAHLRSYERIVIHPRCVHTLEEARLYSFKVDRLSGNILPEPVDKFNHCLDALRYALEPLMGNGGSCEWWKQFFREQARRDQGIADLPSVALPAGGFLSSPGNPNFPNRPAPQPKVADGGELREIYDREFNAGAIELERGNGCAACGKPLGNDRWEDGHRKWHRECYRPF